MINKYKNTNINNLFGSEFEFIEHGFCDGQYNMDFDLERTHLCAEGKALPMFRLYGWNPWTVSLGYNQKAQNINESLVSKKGFGLVRRPTGGRAVLHADELTYSVVLNLPEKISVHDAYREIHILLLKGLQNLGANNIGFEKSQADLREFYKKEAAMSVSCFASMARYEIELDGRKIVGSAQRLFGNTLLQHGSILLDKGHEQLAEVANAENSEKRKVLKNYILSHSATVSEACGRKINFDECKNSILAAIISK